MLVLKDSLTSVIPLVILGYEFSTKMKQHHNPIQEKYTDTHKLTLLQLKSTLSNSSETFSSTLKLAYSHSSQDQEMPGHLTLET